MHAEATTNDTVTSTSSRRQISHLGDHASQPATDHASGHVSGPMRSFGRDRLLQLHVRLGIGGGVSHLAVNEAVNREGEAKANEAALVYDNAMTSVKSYESEKQYEVIFLGMISVVNLAGEIN